MHGVIIAPVCAAGARGKFRSDHRASAYARDQGELDYYCGGLPFSQACFLKVDSKYCHTVNCHSDSKN